MLENFWALFQTLGANYRVSSWWSYWNNALFNQDSLKLSCLMTFLSFQSLNNQKAWDTSSKTLSCARELFHFQDNHLFFLHFLLLMLFHSDSNVSDEILAMISYGHDACWKLMPMVILQLVLSIKFYFGFKVLKWCYKHGECSRTRKGIKK